MGRSRRPRLVCDRDVERAVRVGREGFRICDGKGFHVTFPNGWTVSVQFGGGNYCENYDARIGGEDYRLAGERGSRNAECAVWGPGGTMVDPWGEWNNSVSNRSSVEEVLKLFNWAASQPVEVAS